MRRQSAEKTMRRDLDLIREMMLALEANPDLNGRATVDGFASSFFGDVKSDAITALRLVSNCSQAQ